MLVLCGILSYIRYLYYTDFETVYLTRESNELLDNCIYRFFTQMQVKKFLQRPFIMYLKRNIDGCRPTIDNAIIKDKRFIQENEIDVTYFKSTTDLLFSIFKNYKDISYSKIRAYERNYIVSLISYHILMILFKFFLLFCLFLPSIIVNPNFIIFPFISFLFPTFYILETINLYCLLLLIKQKGLRNIFKQKIVLIQRSN